MLATHPLAGGPKAARGEGGRGGRCHHWILGQLSLDNPRKKSLELCGIHSLSISMKNISRWVPRSYEERSFFFAVFSWKGITSGLTAWSGEAPERHMEQGGAHG